MLVRVRPALPTRPLLGVISPRRTFFGSSKPQSYEISRTLNGTPRQLYDIVSDVSKYHEFVPFVEESFITERCSRNTPSKAGLQVGWKDVNEKFMCQLKCIPGELVQATSLEIDLFESLETKWKFEEVKGSGDKCKVDFQLDYKFRNPLYDRLSFMFAPKVSEIMIQAFQKRLFHIKREEAKLKYEQKQVDI
ncbi:Coenzyme Q-binding protein COQ10 mitochondrial [Spathaspora sp. JA1]|nr:Coenzyme Q-binding protein COQ10 mitochondrial [Spathaspora sp. JA1]